MTEADTLANALSALLKETGKLAQAGGKWWRLDHSELMDAHEAAGDALDNYRTLHPESIGE